MSLAVLVNEKPTKYTQHDQLFKDLIHTFLEEFLDVFFPEIHKTIDFGSIKPLSEEVFTDLFEGDTRRLDIVIEAKLTGKDTVIIIHVEPQSYVQPDFHERMYHYFSLLYNKYRKPIVPIAVFSYEEDRDAQSQFTIGFPYLHVLTFNFLSLQLRKMSWRYYIESNNPVAAALMSKMGYSDKEKIQVKKEFLRIMVRMKLNPAKERMVYGFFERYLKLNEQEEEKLMEEIKQLDDAEKILELPISYEEKGIEKGIKKVAIEMIKEGFPFESIAKVTHLDRNEIEKLKENI